MICAGESLPTTRSMGRPRRYWLAMRCSPPPLKPHWSRAPGSPSDRVVAAAACLAHAAGARGMVGGQSLDMAAEGRAVTRRDVEDLQKLKTGALLSAAAEMGCVIAGGGTDDRLPFAATPRSWDWPSRSGMICWM